MNETRMTFLTFLAATLAVVGVSTDDTRGSGNVYHGRYTRNVPEPYLLVPRLVKEDGSFDTYSLTTFYDRHEEEDRVRRRRWTPERPEREAKLHLILPFDNVDHHVELSPYHEFISPEMVIETRSSGIASDLNEALRFRRASDRQCHYRGIVRGHENSRAALSLCDGVAGYVLTNHGRYFIEPMNEAVPGQDGQHVHIAYKREAPHENGTETPSRGRCGTKGDWESAWAEQLAKLQERVARNESNAGKRATSPFYGTHSIHRYIEVGLVADRRFLDFHNATDYEQYLLTIMNMVSDFYHDATSGNQIDVVVVRIIYLEKEKEEIDLLISPAAEETLDSFSKWAEKINPKDQMHPNHFDIAVLVTRYDICSEGTNCDLMGLAFVAAACDPAKAACINEDNGLLLGIVVAHEIGHVMGCSHDDPEDSGCPSKDPADDSYYIMSPIVFIYTIRWSTCSRKFITTFLESGLGECLNDNPRSPSSKWKYPQMLPGAMYDVEFQCKMAFPDSTPCLVSQAMGCDMLWCLTNSSCYTQGVPKADGTKCGEKKWCIHKQCVDMGSRPTAVNGAWGEWGPMSSCSRTCGGGLKLAERECDKPVPANGGRYCLGERKKFTTCNTTPCDPTKPSFRATQCALFDKVTVLSDGLHTWKPYIKSKLDQCALYCINEKNSFMKMSPMVNDSTPCKPGTNYMCISGSCAKVGCDWMINSDAIEDKCGVCNGDGTKCTQVQNEYTEVSKVSGYVKIVTIPRGSRSISIAEKKRSQNTLAIKLEKDDTYCLNGKNREQKDGDYECAGTMIIYTHPEPDKEEIAMKGPIIEDIQLQYVYYKANENPGVSYSYYNMAASTTYKPKYLWEFTEWSKCSANCNGGTMVSEPCCIEEHAGKVSPTFCEGLPRPEGKSSICNQSPCPTRWRVSQWSKCSACDGNKGTRRRKIQCVRSGGRSSEDDVQANLDACKGRVPRQQEECVGTRPCKLTCPKKTRSSDQEPTKSDGEKDVGTLSAAERDEMIDRFVNYGLARYLEKYADDGGSKLERSAARTDLVSSNYKQLLRDWTAAADRRKRRMEEKEDRKCPDQKERQFTTMKPGSIIKDSIPISSVVLLEAPYDDGGLRANLSDKAFQESGDLVGASIDTSREKIYRGNQAVKKIEELARSKSTKEPPRALDKNTTDVDRTSR